MIEQNNYWIKREKKNIETRLRNQSNLEREIDAIYQRALTEIQKEITDDLQRYASKENISMSDVRRRVSDLDVKAFSEKAKRYVKDKDFSQQANYELRIYNLKMRINRLELIRQNIMLELVATSDELEKKLRMFLSDEVLSEAKIQAGILGIEFSDLNKQAESIVNGSYKNATFSERIWGILQVDLRTSLERLLSKAIIQGLSPYKIARELKELFDVTTNQAKRLARTELARIQSEVQLKSYEKNDIDKFIFIRESNACKICQSVTTKPIQVKDLEIGVNVAPIHPNCRCSTAPYFDREVFDEYLKGKGL